MKQLLWSSLIIFGLLLCAYQLFDRGQVYDPAPTHVQWQELFTATRLPARYFNGYREDPSIIPDSLELAFGECKNPCVIRHSAGGTLFLFQVAAQEVKDRRIAVVIDGPLYSAAALFADKARPFVCITPRASFHFHKAYLPGEYTIAGMTVRVQTDLSDPPHSRDIDDWIKKSRGGYPVAVKKRDFLHMHFAEASLFWPVCRLRSDLP